MAPNTGAGQKQRPAKTARSFKIDKSAPQRKKTGTVTTKKHRFESFSKRITKISIEPIRRGQGRSHVHQQDEASHFQVAFAEWKELNLSASFTVFAARVEPLSHNLPQILLYQDRIMDLLVEYISKHESVALEPLLNLVAHFAHDLGARFEKHFERAVSVVSQLAAKHADVAVIEWSFTCLAWLFKYLSRLLVPDLRPTYNLMAPLLGREHQKGFVMRFAAEAMSFLVRKAGAGYAKNKASLEGIIEHAFKDLHAAPVEQISQYQEGLVTLFAESIKGVQMGVFTHAHYIVEALLSHLETMTKETNEADLDLETVRYVLIDVIHNSDSDGFQPVVAAAIKALPDTITDPEMLHKSATILFVLIGTRKGTRIQDWDSVLQRVGLYVDSVDQQAELRKQKATTQLLKVIASILQYCPLDKVVPFSQQVLRKLNATHWDVHFLGFCIYVADLGVDRFDSLVLPALQKFVTSRWELHEDQLCLLLPRFAGVSYAAIAKLRLPNAAQAKILHNFQLLSSDAVHTRSTANVLSLCNRYIDLLSSLTAEPVFLKQLADIILDVLEQQLEAQSIDHANERIAFLFSKALLFMACNVSEEKLSQAFLQSIIPLSEHHGRRLDYLRSLFVSCDRTALKLEPDGSSMSGLMAAIIPNLAGPSHDLREATLQLMRIAYNGRKATSVEALDVALQVEHSTFSAEAARGVSLNVRKIAALYVESAHQDVHLATALPAFCFGLLSVRLTSAWDDASTALETMSKAEGKEDVIIDRALAWLQPYQDLADTAMDVLQDDEAPGQATRSYHCSNLLTLEHLANRDLVPRHSTEEHLNRAFHIATALLPIRSPVDRAQALQVLVKISYIAERKSRVLVPVLLKWALGEDNVIVDSLPIDQDGEQTSVATERWNRKDQKALLQLFSLFVNPSVLFKSEEVYQALLGLLCNGDVEIQTSALKAIFAWKSPSIRPYEENLRYILDDARFRDEISVFLNISEEDSKIRDEHRAGLMPVVLSMLYGRIVTRTGGSNRGTQQSKRRAVLLALARFGQENLSNFMHIALGRLDNLELIENDSISENDIDKDIVSVRKQLGMLNMLDDTLDTLGDVVAPFAKRLISAILYCTIRATRQVLSTEAGAETENASLLRSVRQSGYSCLISLFTACPKVDWNPYAAIIVRELINPRLEKLPIETAQGVSAVLKLVASWSENAQTVDFLVRGGDTLLTTVADCLVVPSAKEEVKVYILNNIFKIEMERAQTQSATSQPGQLLTHLDNGLGSAILDRVATMLKSTSERNTFDAAIRVMTGLAPSTVNKSTSSSVKNAIESCLHVLGLPTRLINPRLKGDILILLDQIVPLYDFSGDEAFFDSAIRVVSSLFSFFLDAQNRLRLASVFQKLCVYDSTLMEAASLCEDLNAFSSARLDEPDFERRLRAFTIINDEKFDQFSARQWHPIIHNMLYHVKDNQELSIRTSASLTLRKFVQKTCTHPAVSAEQTALLSDSLLPAVQNGMREASELIRAEYVAVLAEIVRGKWPATNDMQALLGADEESAFFNNILHIQQHRRTRALRRLAEAAKSISSINVARFCVPLIENFYISGDGVDHNLASEAINTLDALAEALEWPRYRALLQRMVGEAAKFDSRIKIRAMGAVSNALLRAARSKKASADKMNTEATEVQLEEPRSQLVRTLPDYKNLSSSLSKSVLGKLTEQVHFKDESTVDLRILVATSAVKIIMCHSPDEIDLLLPPLLLDICNILKSKSQEARDSTRKTLADISAIAGSRYFGFLVKQLRSALTSGPQRHVLSYTVHSILVSVSPSFAAGEIDYCLPEIMEIIIEDIFGMVASEKEAQGYLSKMKEVKKKSLSYDSMELLASITTLPHVTALLQPLQEQLTRPRPRFEKIDELLRRLREGLRRNQHTKSQDFLTLCYEILSNAYKNTAAATTNNADPSSFKMASFALELLRRILDKHEELKTVSNLSGFLPLLRTSMAQGVEEVEIASMRLFTSIIKVPLPEIDSNAKLYVRLAKRLIESASSTSTPVSQAALRLVSAVLRERPNADIPKYDWEESIAFILNRIKPDLQEPAKQGDRDLQVAAFNFLRAIINRKEPVAEVYGVMDVVREVMITSSESPIPDLARSVYTRFVLDYFPEELKGFSKQLDFLVANLRYPTSRGRQSVMEVIMFVLDRRSEDAVQSMLMTFFLPLIVAFATDDNEQCRDSAALIIHKIFERADKERTKTFRGQMLKWLIPEADALWRSAGLQCWAIYFDVHTTASKEAATVYAAAADILTSSVDDEIDSDLVHRALELVTKLCTTETLSAVPFAASTSATWDSLPSHIAHTSLTVRVATARLISLYLVSFAKAATSRNESVSLPIRGTHGLELTPAAAIAIVEPSMQLLQTETDDAIITQTIQNLGFIGRLAAASPDSTVRNTDTATTSGGESPSSFADDDDDVEAEADTDIDTELTADATPTNLLTRLLLRSASVLRTELTPSRTKLSALTLLTSLVKSSTPSTLPLPVLYRLILPLANLTDASIPLHASSSSTAPHSHKRAHPTTTIPSTESETTAEALTSGAHALLEHLQGALGSTAYIAARQVVAGRVRERREERRRKRVIEKVSQPERYEEGKRRKRVLGKERKRERNGEMAGRRRGW